MSVAVKSFRDRNPYFIGLGSIVIIGVLVAIAFLVGIKHLLEHNYKVRAVFSDAAGIRGGDVVRVAGVKSGRVVRVRADRIHGNVIVDLVVNDNIKLGQDAHAEVALETLLGTKYVRLSGPVHAPYLRDMPSSQRVIPIERTKTPFDVFELTKIGTRSTLVALIDQSQAILDLVTRRRGDIAAGLQAGNAAMGEVAGVLDRNSTQIDAILNTLHPTVNLVEKHQADLDRALTLIGPGSYGLGRAAAHGPWAEVYVRGVGPDYVALIKQQFPNGLPVEAGK